MHRDDYTWGERAIVISVEGDNEVLKNLGGASIDTLLLLKKYTFAAPADWEAVKASLANVFTSVDTLGLSIYADKKNIQNIKTAFPNQSTLLNFIENETGSSQIELLTQSKSVLEKYFNGQDTLSLKVSGTLVEKDNNLISKEYWKGGVHFVNDGAFSKVLCIKNMQPPSRKNLDEVRGKVVSDYQEFLETVWLDELKAKYPVKVNSKALKDVVKRINEK
jgi:peptidyl-prolyl cis-trans isomerase SurA